MFGRKKRDGAPKEAVRLIDNAGGCMCTRSVYEDKTRLKWCFREASVNPVDNGWRFIGESDTEEYINVTENNVILDFNTVANIEPAVLSIYNMPIGTDLRLEKSRSGAVTFYDSNTGAEVKI